LKALRDQYLLLLAEGIVPLWMRALDHNFGGVFSCMSEDGVILSTDKYIWSQARFAWTLSALYNRFEPRPEFIAHARKTIDFLLKHGRDQRGRFVYRTTREGAPLEGANSI
jgi:N-acylglucosamine 2-epimerase